VDGLWPICDGCRYRLGTYRQLVTKFGMSKTQAEEECRRRFDVLSHVCSRCMSRLPATFFHQGRKICISCRRVAMRQYREGIVPDVPSIKECGTCHRKLSSTCFNTNAGMHSGLSSTCKDCNRKIKLKHSQARRKVPVPVAMQSAERRCRSCIACQASQCVLHGPLAGGMRFKYLC